MRIGLISDTHGCFDQTFVKHFAICDQVWHAGDIGNETTLHQFRAAFPQFRAVYGNIDDTKVRMQCPKHMVFDCEGMRILLIHIAGSFGKYSPEVKLLIALHQPQILFCGHSHIAKVAYDRGHELLYINPGAAGHKGFHSVRTLMRFSIENGKAKEMELIELGKRGSLV